MAENPKRKYPEFDENVMEFRAADNIAAPAVVLIRSKP